MNLVLYRPLHDAVDSDCIEIARLLLAAGADINLTTYSGKTVESLARSHDMRAFFRGALLNIAVISVYITNSEYALYISAFETGCDFVVNSSSVIVAGTAVGLCLQCFDAIGWAAGGASGL